MANNRMYLVYEPTGLAIALGKRMGWGWYVSNAADKPFPQFMNDFYDLAISECEGDQDAFIIVKETDDIWELLPEAEANVPRGLLRFRRVSGKEEIHA
jgi:hypothetical protein